MAAAGECRAEAGGLADLRHRFRSSAVRWGEAGEAGLPDGILERRDGAPAHGTDGPHGLPPGGQVHAATCRVANILAGPSQPGPLSQYLGPPPGRLRPEIG